MPLTTRQTPPPPHFPDDSGKVIVLAISGASGAPYAIRLLDLLLTSGHTVHLVVSDFGRRLLADEMDITDLHLTSLLPSLAASEHADQYDARIIRHPNKDVGAVIASGSFIHHGMVVLPCSSNSLASIATGAGSNLLTRAAQVTLKERRPLIIAHRESPLSLIDIENMRTATLAGAIIAPTNPGLYLIPKSIDDLTDFIVAKILDLLHLPHTLDTRWSPGRA